MPLEDVSDRANKVYDAMKSAGATSEDRMKDADAITKIAKLPKGMALSALQELEAKGYAKRRARDKAAGYYLRKCLLLQQGRDEQRQDHGGVALDRDLLRLRADLVPRDGLADARPGQGAVPLRRRRHVHRVVEPVAELVPPDRVVLADPATDHERPRPLG